MVGILLGEGFEESEALITADLLRRAGVEVALVGTTAEPVVSSHKVRVAPDMVFSELPLDKLEMLILPGGLGGVNVLQNSARVKELIRTCYDQEIYLAAICAAPTILAQMGLLDGKEAVCYPGMEDQMGAAVCSGKSPVVVSGRIITGEACGSTFTFALKLIELLKDKETADRVREDVHYRG